MLKFIRNLIAYSFLRAAQRSLDSAKRIYGEYEGTDYGQQMGDFAMEKFQFYQSVAMAIVPKEKPTKFDVEYETRHDVGRMP